MTLDPKQKAVLRGMVRAAIVAIGTLFLVFMTGMSTFGGLESGAARRLAGGWALALLALPLIVCIARLAAHRFFSPADIDGSTSSGDTEQAKVLQAILQNTTEQTLLAALVHAACVLLLPLSWLQLVPAAAVLFLIGRLTFTVGYPRGAAERAFGFGLTFYPTLLLLFVLLASGGSGWLQS